MRHLHGNRQWRVLPTPQVTAQAGAGRETGVCLIAPGEGSLNGTLLWAGTTTAYPNEESDARKAMARDQARGISSFTDFPAQGRQNGARWHGAPLSELHKPVLVMCGDTDSMLRPRASRDTAAIPGARPVISARCRGTHPACRLAHHRPGAACPRRRQHTRGQLQRPASSDTPR
jgi:hypothetical protein